MAEYEELRTALRWLLLSQLAPMPRYMRGRLGNGQGKVKVPGRHDDYSYVRPSRSTDDVIEVFNKEVSGGDGTPVLVGELPWQPGLTQIVSVDWETYIQVGWGDGYAGIALHGPTHVWRDGFVATDTFNVFRRQIAPMRTYPVGSGSQSVYVSTYDYLWNGQPISWCGLPGLDLSAATPATGQARLMLTYLDMENNVLGVVTGTIDVHSDAIELARPALPTGTWAPSAYVRLFGGQGTISESKDIRDARQLWNSASAVPSGPAGGDLTGTYPDPTVRAIQGFPVSSATPNEGDLLVFTGTSWAPRESPWMRAISGAAYQTLFDQSDTLQSAAIISGGAITDNGDGTVAVAAGEGLVKTTNSAVGENHFMEWTADPSVTMVTGTINWLYVDYNAGSPQVAVESASIYNVDLRTEVVLGRVWREGTTSHCLNAGQQFANYMTVACFKDFEVWGFQRASGIVTSEIGTRSIDVTAGVMYCAHNRITTSHSTGTFSSWYRDGGGGWTEVANQMQIDNANYDDGSGVLAALTPNRYAVHWVYMDYDGDHLHVQYGQGDYTKAGAEDAIVPTTLPFLQAFALLIAKITVQEGSATFESIQLPWDVQFTGASPVDHGDLAGLGDDDHPQYLLVGAEACGDLTGTYPCPQVSGLHGYSLLSTVPQPGYGLMFTGSAWRPIPWPGATPSGAAGGDLTGSYPNPLVVGVNGDPIDTGVAPTEGDALIYSASGTNYWRPADHGYIGGLAGDDHVQYLLIDGTRAMTGELEANEGISIPTAKQLKFDDDEDTSIRCPSPYDDRMRFRFGGVDIFDIWVTGTNYWFHGLADGYDWGLWGYDAGHNRKQMIHADPDDTVQLFYAGATRFNTSADGISIPQTMRLDLDVNNDTSIRCTGDDVLVVEIGGVDKFTFNAAGLTAVDLIAANQLQSTVAGGTAPLVVASTTKVTNLNADLLDGYTTAAASTNNTIALRNASGNLYADVYYTDNPPVISPITAICAEEANNGAIGHATEDAVRAFLGAPLHALSYDTSAATTSPGAAYTVITQFNYTVPAGETHDICLLGLITVWGSVARDTIAQARFYRGGTALAPAPSVGGAVNDRQSLMVMTVDAGRTAGTVTYRLYCKKIVAGDTVTIGATVPTFAIGFKR